MQPGKSCTADLCCELFGFLMFILTIFTVIIMTAGILPMHPWLIFIIICAGMFVLSELYRNGYSPIQQGYQPIPTKDSDDHDQDNDQNQDREHPEEINCGQNNKADKIHYVHNMTVTPSRLTFGIIYLHDDNTPLSREELVKYCIYKQIVYTEEQLDYQEVYFKKGQTCQKNNGANDFVLV